MSVTSSALFPVCVCVCVEGDFGEIGGEGETKKTTLRHSMRRGFWPIFFEWGKRPGWWLTPNSFHTRRPALETPLSCLESHQGSFFPPTSLCGWQFKILGHSGIRFPAKIWPFIPLEAGGLKRPLFEITCLDFFREIVVVSNIFTSFV